MPYYRQVQVVKFIVSLAYIVCLLSHMSLFFAHVKVWLYFQFRMLIDIIFFRINSFIENKSTIKKKG